MNFSYEELYFMYGQYDTNVYLTFKYQTKSFEIFGFNIMGTFIYTEQERQHLEASLANPAIPRTDTNIRFLPSSVEKLTKDQWERAERYGFLCSDIVEVLSYNKPRQNRFIGKDKKEIENPIAINVGRIKPDQLNNLNYGFLDRRFKQKGGLSPNECNKYLGLRKYLSLDNSSSPYKEIDSNPRDVRYYELDAKYIALEIEKEEIKELVDIVFERHHEREALIEREIQQSSQQIKEVAEKYGDELKALKSICHKYEEEVILYGDKIVFLDFERFVHIYARHVSETQIGNSLS